MRALLSLLPPHDKEGSGELEAAFVQGEDFRFRAMVLLSGKKI